jgi:hypothetical protein
MTRLLLVHTHYTYATVPFPLLRSKHRVDNTCIHALSYWLDKNSPSCIVSDLFPEGFPHSSQIHCIDPRNTLACHVLTSPTSANSQSEPAQRLREMLRGACHRMDIDRSMHLTSVVSAIRSCDTGAGLIFWLNYLGATTRRQHLSPGSKVSDRETPRRL